MSYTASHSSNEEMPAGANARRNYNAEGRRLIESLGLQAGGMYNAMDAVWKDSSTGGKIYVGNETAARGPASTMAERGITHVVNCTDDMPNFCEAEAASSGVTYLRFNVAYWQSAGVMQAEQPASRQEVMAFLQQLFDFVEGATKLVEIATVSLSFSLSLSLSLSLLWQHLTSHWPDIIGRALLRPSGALEVGSSVLVHCLAGAHRAAAC